MASNAGYNKMFPVSWTELHRDARALAWRLADLGPFKGLVAITRGGLVPAAIIAHFLEGRIRAGFRRVDGVVAGMRPQLERYENKGRVTPSQLAADTAPARKP